MSDKATRDRVGESRKKSCNHLRWKGMYVEAEPDPEVPNTRDGLYWCAHTMTLLGPDGRVADVEACVPGRGCFVAR